MARKRKGKIGSGVPAGLKPPKIATVQPVPPPGYYDPALDSQLGSVQRGFGDTQADFTRNYGTDGHGGRAFNDYTLGRGDILRAAQRAFEDLGTARSREQQGYTQRTQDLGTQYQRLGSSQTQRAHAMGVMGGALVQAAQKRAANQGHDQGLLDTAHNNAVSDFSTQQSRLFGDSAPDFGTGTLGGDYGNQLGRLGLGYQRQIEDAGTTLLRAQRDAGQFGIDTAASKLFSARQNGWIPPAPRPVSSSQKTTTRRRRGRGPIASINMPGSQPTVIR